MSPPTMLPTMPPTKWVVKNTLTDKYLYRVLIPPDPDTGGCLWGDDVSQALDCQAEDMALVICDIWNITVPQCCQVVEVIDREKYN